jgi:tripartite-type tricarboxylate transporter receptor subunit TctC
MTLTRLIAAAALLLLGLGSAEAQNAVGDFYKGKSFTIIVGSDAGGGHDLYARLLAKHMARYIPGNPTIVIQNMPGASGIVATNYIANAAAKDGSVIAALYPGNVVEPLLESGAAIKYDPRTLGWIGNIDSLQLSCFMNAKGGIKNINDAKGREVLVGATSPQSSSAFLPNVMNQLIGTRFKVLTGYSTGDLWLAFERGEINGICGQAYSTIQQSQPQMLKDKALLFIAQSGVKPIADLPGVPMVADFAVNPEDKAIFELLDMRVALGRPYTAPPGVPADRLAALRDAFDKTMNDKDYLAEADKAGQQVNYIDYKGMEKVVSDAYAMPPSVIQRVIELSKSNK